MYHIDEDDNYNYGYGPPVDFGRVTMKKSVPGSPVLTHTPPSDAYQDPAAERLAILLDRYHNPRDYDEPIIDKPVTLDYSPRQLSPAPAPQSKPKRTLKSAFDFQTKPSAIFQSGPKSAENGKEVRRRNLLGFPIKERDPDLIARMIRDRSKSTQSRSVSPELRRSKSRSSRSPSASKTMDLPKPEDYGVPRKRRSSFREVPDYSEEEEFTESQQRFSKNMGRMFNNSWKWLTGGVNRYPGSEARDPYSSSIRSTSKSSSRNHSRSEKRSVSFSSNSGPLALITEFWIKLLEGVPALGFLLSIIPHNSLRLPVILLQIFLSLWALYYFILLLEIVSSVVKAVCSPAIFLASFFTGKRR